MNFLRHVTSTICACGSSHRMNEFTHKKRVSSARLTQLDYARADGPLSRSTKHNEMVGVVRIHSDSIYETAIRDPAQIDLKGKGLGWALMQLIMNTRNPKVSKRSRGTF